MYSRLRAHVLFWLKVPPEPHPPAGAPASLRVFRAGRNLLRLRLLGWAVPQVFALAGIIFWTVVLLDVERTAEARRNAPPPPVAATPTPAPAATPAPVVSPAAPAEATAPASPKASTRKAPRPKVRLNDWDTFRQMLVALALRLPPWMFPLLWLFKVGGVVLYLAQIPVTYAIRRLDFELRWYVVTDRSLRIRAGVWQVQELTMSFANLQQVEVSQGPVQRLLGLADVRVQSAGGSRGKGPAETQHAGESLHTAVFHGVENAEEIRDLILERLRVFRATGLGDPDEPGATAAPPSIPAAADRSTLAAAQELLTEARALRRTLAAG